MEILLIKNEYYSKRREIKAELKKRGLFAKTYPRKLSEVPADMRHMFEMIEPDTYAL